MPKGLGGFLALKKKNNEEGIANGNRNNGMFVGTDNIPNLSVN